VGTQDITASIILRLMKIAKIYYATLLGGLLISCTGNQNKTEMSNDIDSIRIIALDPGHFHAALVQKSMYDGVSSTINVYGPEGPELESYINFIERFNSRADKPTSWQTKIYSEPDFLETMLSEKKGNVVVLAGQNEFKTKYIQQSVDAGLNVLSDKPMAINSEGFKVLEEAFKTAEKNKVLLYDIMTSRYDITSILQKEILQDKSVFGEIEKGNLEHPAIIKKSVHHFYKEVSGKPLIRPAWYYDVKQVGEGIVDVTTHAVDIIQWICFPEQAINYKNDIHVLSAKKWSTPINIEQYSLSTTQKDWPSYLKPEINDNVLSVFANGEINYKIKDSHSRVSVIWNFKAPEGSADTHYSMIRGTNSNLIIKQGKEQNFKPVLYIEPTQNDEENFKQSLNKLLQQLQNEYEGIDFLKEGKYWKFIIPEKYNIGHEEQFSEVTKKYLSFLKERKLPDWEVPNMLSKYYTTTKALEIAETIKVR
jgi:predicted dehydrogenase